MKAVFEFDVPESCEDCPLEYDCKICKATGNPISDWANGDKDVGFNMHKERAPFCPLKIVDDSTPKGVKDSTVIDFVCEKCGCKFSHIAAKCLKDHGRYLNKETRKMPYKFEDECPKCKAIVFSEVDG